FVPLYEYPKSRESCLWYQCHRLYVDLEKRIRSDHPLRAIRALTDSALVALSGDFAALYSGLGRPSIAPEMLLRAMLLLAFYSVRSERQLMERLEFTLGADKGYDAAGEELLRRRS